MKRLLTFLACLIALCIPLTAQQPLISSINLTTVAPPSNVPLTGTGFGLVCSGSAGSFSAGTLVIAYTFTGVDANSETKASADGGTTLTTLVTCPANGTLTIPSPPSPPGCANCVGWRPYAIASSSGTGAELLQTISASTCTLSATSSLTACAIGSNFTETSLGAGAAEPSNPSLFTTGFQGLAAQASLSESSLYGNHLVYWTVTGSIATCTVTIQTASTLTGSYSTMTNYTAQTCTSSGSYQVTGQVANFVRIGALTFTATGANVPSITITLVSSLPPIQPAISGSIVTGLSFNSSGQATLASQGTNQNVVLTPSGTGVVLPGANGYGAGTGGGAGSGIVMFADTGNPAAGTTGTNTTGVANQLWYTTLYAPHSFTVSNMAVLSGGTATTDKIAMGIWSLSGTLLACTATTVGGGTTLSGANTWQKLALSASCPNGATTFVLVGGTHYIVGVVTSGTTAGDIQTYPLANGPLANVASAQGTLATFTPAVTQTISVAPYIMVQ